MGVEHTFYDYVNENGENTIHAWLHSIPKKARQKFTKWLIHLEALNQGEWKRPFVDTLTDRECDGLFEIRVRISKIQYRLLGCHGITYKDPTQLPKTPTLLHGFIKTTGPVSQADCSKAHRIWTVILTNLDKYGVEHDYE